MKPERNRTRIIRLYKIERLLLTEAEGMKVVDLAERLSVNRRTIYRDLELIQELGIPLYEEEDSRFKILGTYTVPSYRAKLIEPLGVNSEHLPSLS